MYMMYAPTCSTSIKDLVYIIVIYIIKVKPQYVRLETQNLLKQKREHTANHQSVCSLSVCEVPYYDLK